MVPLIELDHAGFEYAVPGGKTIPALRDISLKVEEGDYVAVIGANGSGKTTLARHFNALLVPTSGKVLVSGWDTRERANHQNIRKAVGMVFQFPEDQIVATVVEEDVAFGPENLGLDPVEIRRRVDEALQEVGLWEQRLRPPHLLSAGQMQRVALAGALAMRPRCIVFDETTAMLDPAGRRMVLDNMDRLHRNGMTILSITHFMEEAARADRVIVLSHGQIAMDGAPQQVFADADLLAGLGLDLPPAAKIARELRPYLPNLGGDLLTAERLIDALPPFSRSPEPFLNPSAPVEQDIPLNPAIIVNNLFHTYLSGTPLEYRALNGISLQVNQKSAFGIVGATGSGKSTLLQHLNGLLLPQEGTVKIGPYDLNSPKVDVKAVRRLAGLVFQIPETQLFEQYVGDEIAYGPRLMGVKENLREQVRWAMQLVGLDFEGYKDRLTFTLSGGERRKVALASVLSMKPDILLLDEPAAGLDPAARRELLAKLKQMQSQGITLVFSSHQMEDMAVLADQLTVVNNGRDVMSGSTRQIFSQSDRLKELGLEPPIVTRVSDGMRKQGWPLSAGITTRAVLIEEVGQLMGDPIG
ncbi:MAG: energy-coupling factor transporter ATPase [Anaerolineaceae bacterium]|nr:energy-coupling factor transporter ATPase [Anaerolineaceae bacterium]